MQRRLFSYINSVSKQFSGIYLKLNAVENLKRIEIQSKENQLMN